MKTWKLHSSPTLTENFKEVFYNIQLVMFRGKKTTFGMGWGVAQWQDAGLACEALS
jgi:hypothetical protein